MSHTKIISIFLKENLRTFSNAIKQTANFMNISRKINLVGTASMKSIKYFNDFNINQLFDRIKVS